MIYVVGKVFGAFSNYLDKNGYKWALLHDVILGEAPKDITSLPVDFSSKKTVLSSISEFPELPTGIVAVYEGYVLPTSWISTYFKLPGNTEETAEAASDKSIMRNRFKTADRELNPANTLVDKIEDVEKFLTKNPLPAIIKPVGLSKSLLVSKVNTLQEAKQTFLESVRGIDQVYKKYAPHKKPQLMIEEFMEGRVFSVDAVMNQAGKIHLLSAIVDYETGYEVGFDDIFHYSRLLPTKLDHATQEDLKMAARSGIKALQLRSCNAHVELILTENGPRIVEIAARMGGYRERMHRLANGVDMYKAMIAAVTGNTIDVTCLSDYSCAVIELFPHQRSEFEAISRLSELKNLRSFHTISIKTKPGEIVGRAAEGYKACASLTLFNEDSNIFNEDLEFVRNKVRVESSP